MGRDWFFRLLCRRLPEKADVRGSGPRFCSRGGVLCRACVPQDCAEAAGVAVAQQCAVGELYVGVVVFAGFGGGVSVYPYAAGHAQMDEQDAGIKTDEQVFGAAAALAHGFAGQNLRQFGWDGPAQFGLADADGGNGFAGDIRGDAVQDGFYFGKFGHGFAFRVVFRLPVLGKGSLKGWWDGGGRNGVSRRRRLRCLGRRCATAAR